MFIISIWFLEPRCKSGWGSYYFLSSQLKTETQRDSTMVDSRTKLESSLQMYFIFQVRKEVPYLQNLRIFFNKTRYVNLQWIPICNFTVRRWYSILWKYINSSLASVLKPLWPYQFSWYLTGLRPRNPVLLLRREERNKKKKQRV